MNQNKHGMQMKLQVICLTSLFLCLVITIASIMERFVGLNDSVEYERVVFVSQIAKQMKNNMITSRSKHMELIQNMAEVLNEMSPQSFEEVRKMFPSYAKNKSVNQLFFLSSDCELFGMDGVKRWTSLPYEEYLFDAISQEYTTDFIRIGMNQEFMVYSTLIPAHIKLDGHEMVAVMYAWESSEYRTVLSSTLFEEKSSSLLVRTDGSIAIYPEDKDSELYGYNIFTYLNNQSMTSRELQIVKDMVADTDDDTILCDVGGSRWLLSVAQYSDTYRILIMLPIEVTSSGTYNNLYGLLGSIGITLLILFFIVGIILVFAFWRQREQREKELQTELLMKTAQAKNEFLAKMSHDIRTPLNGIIGMNYIASTKNPRENIEVANCLKKVDISAKYLLGILNDILDMSKIESGQIKLSETIFSLEELKESVEPIIYAQLEEKNISYAIDYPKQLNYSYIGDELRIKQILINLLSNAIKFTEEGSVTFIIRVKVLTDEKDKVIFTVRDTGKGMTEKFMENIFSPFTQEDSNISARYGGSGLGLAITKSFVDLMGGMITVSSEPDKGSEFVVSIPLKRTNKTKKKEVTSESLELSKNMFEKCVLLCEDNELNAEIATEILKNFGLKVDWAENGKKGVEKFKQSVYGEYAMIFMDVRMPEMDGYEATRTIRSLDRLDAKEVPICALSANAFTEDIKQSMDSGMNEHLAKPVEIGKLDEVLKKYLR